MTHDIVAYKRAIQTILNLDKVLTEEQREELMDILKEARESIPPEILASLDDVARQLYTALEEEEVKVLESYVRDL
jgi:uncharacterized protein with von Willebrand factor type A (vWA) domain